MQNFIFKNPTKIIFGKGEIKRLPELIPANTKILMTYGGGSIKNNGVYDQVKQALSRYDVTEFSGIEPNPRYETLMEAVNVIKKENINFILAVGGGSVIDGTKFIAAVVNFDGEPWDILAKHAEVKSAIPFGAILTLPATGTEMNNGSVVSRGDDKLFFGSEHVFPQFSILDPETTYTLPPRQIGNGIVDAYTHVMEQYLTYPMNAQLQDRFAESILQTLIDVGPKTLKNPHDYAARSDFMWSTTMALNGLLSCGVPSDWSTHRIGHEITALYGLDHAQTLAIILPSVMQIQRKQKQEKILQYAKRVWNIESDNPDHTIDAAIKKTRNFFESVGVPTKLSVYNIGREAIPKILTHLQTLNYLPMGEQGDMTIEIIEKVLVESL